MITADDARWLQNRAILGRAPQQTEEVLAEAHRAILKTARYEENECVSLRVHMNQMVAEEVCRALKECGFRAQYIRTGALVIDWRPAASFIPQRVQREVL